MVPQVQQAYRVLPVYKANLELQQFKEALVLLVIPVTQVLLVQQVLALLEAPALKEVQVPQDQLVRVEVQVLQDQQVLQVRQVQSQVLPEYKVQRAPQARLVQQVLQALKV